MIAEESYGENRYDGNDDPITIFLLTSTRRPSDSISNPWFTKMTESHETGRRILAKQCDTPPFLKPSRRREISFEHSTWILAIYDVLRKTSDEIVAPQVRRSSLLFSTYEDDGVSLKSWHPRESLTWPEKRRGNVATSSAIDMK